MRLPAPLLILTGLRLFLASSAAMRTLIWALAVIPLKFA
jgi:hypothetical protein